MTFVNGVWFRNLNGPGTRRAAMRLRSDDGGGGGGPAGDPPKVPPKDDNADPKPKDDDDADDGKTFTQAQLQSKVEREARQAASAAMRKLSEETGMSIEELKALAENKAKADEEAKSDVEKALESAAAAQAQAEAAQAEALATVQRNNLYDRLTDPGTDPDSPLATLNPARKEAALTIAQAAIAGFDGDAADALDHGVEAVRKQAPEFFGEGSNGGSAGTNGVRTPGRTGDQTKPPGGTSALEKAKAMLEKHADKAPKVVGSPSES